MPAVLALVDVLELLYVQDYRSLVMDDNGYGLPVSTRPSDNALHCLSGLTLNAYQCRVLVAYCDGVCCNASTRAVARLTDGFRLNSMFDGMSG